MMFKDIYHIGRFWTDESKAAYIIPDYMLKQEFAEHKLNNITPNLVNIYHPETHYYTAQVAYSYFDSIKHTSHVFCVYTFAIERERDSLKFFPIIHTYKFKSYKNDLVALHVRDTTHEYAYILDSLSSYNLKLAKLFSIVPVKFTCYKFNDFAELNSCVGLDVQLHNARDEKNAYCDMYNKIIYGTSFECYFHELVHLYVGHQYLLSCHNMINEGLATYLGGSYISLEKHLSNLSTDLQNHKEYDLNNFLDLKFKVIDDKPNTSYKYTLGGLLCKLVYQKKGIDGLKALLSSGSSDDELYSAVCTLLNVKRKDLDVFLRQEVSKYSEKPS